MLSSIYSVSNFNYRVKHPPPPFEVLVFTVLRNVLPTIKKDESRYNKTKSGFQSKGTITYTSSSGRIQQGDLRLDQGMSHHIVQ